MRRGCRQPWRSSRSMMLLGLALTVGGCADQDGPGGCVMRQIADLPVLSDHWQPIVRAAINGTPVAFIIDTGARGSAIGVHDVDVLHLPTSFDNRHIVTGIGGSTFATDATIDELSLGNTVARRINFMALGHYGGTIDGLPVVGLFGGDFLANYDVEFDLPAHRVAMYTEQNCGGHIRPWATAFYEQPFDLTNGTEIDFTIGIDGKPVEAVLDSGSGRTVLDADAGAVGGATQATMASDRKTMSIGVDGAPVAGHFHRFDSLSVGPERIAPVYLNVADIAAKTLLGADFLRSHRVWVSYRHEMLYIQRVSAMQRVITRPPAPLAPPPPLPGPPPALPAPH